MLRAGRPFINSAIGPTQLPRRRHSSVGTFLWSVQEVENFVSVLDAEPRMTARELETGLDITAALGGTVILSKDGEATVQKLKELIGVGTSAEGSAPEADAEV